MLQLPVFPNIFPYNEMLLRGILRLGDFAVKTRSWYWDYRGLVLLYTSGRVQREPAEAYDLDPKEFPRKAIVGVGELVDVRSLTQKELKVLTRQFNNIKPGERKDPSIWPLPIGFFFKGLQRFTPPVSFNWPQGPVKPIFVPATLVAEELKKLGFSL